MTVLSERVHLPQRYCPHFSIKMATNTVLMVVGILFALFLGVIPCSASTSVCNKQFRGVLLHVKDPEDLSKGCHSTAVLKQDCLELYRGTKPYQTIDLDAIQTPILVTPGSSLCISVRAADKPAEFFCCENVGCRDAWWEALTEKILCKHKVTKMRQEIAGEPTQEEEEEMVLEKVVKKPEEGGINLHIDTGLFEKKPKIKMADEANHLDQGSDPAVPPDMDVEDRSDLWNWRFKAGGERISRFAPKIPHLLETTYPESMMRSEVENLRLCKQLVNEAKQAQMEFVYSKQQADLLQEERELLKWHINNNSKVLNLRRSERRSLEQKTVHLKKRLQSLQNETEIYEKQKQHLGTDTATLEADLDRLREEHESAKGELKEWLERRNDYLMETTAERRLAGDERKKRGKQFSKLRLAINRDKKVHTKLDSWKNLDQAVYDHYVDVHNALGHEYEKAGDVTKPQRETVLEELNAADK